MKGLKTERDLHNGIVLHASTVEEISTVLDSDVRHGLSDEEVQKRTEHFGKNLIEEAESVSIFKILLNQFKGPIVLLLLFAAAMSVWFKDWLDGIAILIVLLVNAGIGFYMEYQAKESMKALKKLSSVPAKVLRNGNLQEINSADIVPGDIVFAEAGDMIPADGRIFKSAQLLIDESALTGESVAVEKQPAVLPEGTVLADRANVAHKGTHVAKGNCHLLIGATGMQTELGKIATLVENADQAATPLEKKLEEFSKRLINITLVLVVIIFVVGLINGKNIIDMLQTAIALAVAAIPEGLPIVATISLARGMLKMARHNVIVKKLSAVETLGGTNVICTDKTGTLTQNRMEVTFVSTPSGTWEKGKDFTGDRLQFQMIVKCSILCNTADIRASDHEKQEIGDPLEIALLKFAQGPDVDISSTRKEFPRKREEPFSSETKYMATLHQHADGFYAFAKGAAEELLLRCSSIQNGTVAPMSNKTKSSWMQKAEDFAALGHRMIAMAYKRIEREVDVFSEDLVFLGLVGMIDPPRPEVFSAIADCKAAGIKVMMITGDHPSTALFIAKQLGIETGDGAAVLGKDMQAYEDLSAEEKDRWAKTSVFARVNPKHKLDIVAVLQEKNYVVGMTGDGVNDAPALKKADIGIAMGQRGTQVAQEVADMVLKDDSFSSIAVAIRQGRIIFQNIKKFVTFLLSCNLSELIVIAIVALMNLPFQLLPLQILFINLITDVLPALALGVTKGGADIMKQPPRHSSEPIIDARRWKLILFYSAVIGVVSIGSVYVHHYIFLQGASFNAVMSNNILFFTLIMCQLLHVFNMGSGKFFSSEVMKNRYVWYALVLSLLILFGLIQIPVVKEALNIIPPTASEWINILGASLTSVAVIQLAKALFPKILYGFTPKL